MIATSERWPLIAEYMVSKGVEDRDAEQCSNRWTLLSKQWKKVRDHQIHSTGNVDYWTMTATERQAAKLLTTFSRLLFEGTEHVLGERACNMPRSTSSSLRGMGVQALSPTSPCPTSSAPASVRVGSTSPSSPPHEIPLLPREHPPVLPTRYTQTSETPFPNSTGNEKKGLGKKIAFGEVLKAFSNSTESLSKLLEVDMKGKANRFKATMEHTDNVLQLEREKFTHSRQAEQAAVVDRAQMVSHFGKMVENLGKLAQKDRE